MGYGKEYSSLHSLFDVKGGEQISESKIIVHELAFRSGQIEFDPSLAQRNQREASGNLSLIGRTALEVKCGSLDIAGVAGKFGGNFGAGIGFQNGFSPLLEGFLRRGAWGGLDELEADAGGEAWGHDNDLRCGRVFFHPPLRWR